MKSSSPMKESEKNAESHSYLTELYTPTRVKEQQSETETNVVNDNLAENYMDSIGKKVKKAMKQDDKAAKPSSEVVDLDMELEIVESYNKIASKAKLSTLIDQLLPPKKKVQTKKVVGKKRFATKDKLREEPTIQKRQAVTNSQEDKIAKVQKVIAEKIDSSASPDEKKNGSDSQSVQEQNHNEVDGQKRKLLKILRKNDDFFSKIDEKFKTFQVEIMNHKKEIGPEMEEIIQNLNGLVRDQNSQSLPNVVQRSDEAEISGNTAASSPKVAGEKPLTTISVHDDASITQVNDEPPKVVESQKIGSQISNKKDSNQIQLVKAQNQNELQKRTTLLKKFRHDKPSSLGKFTDKQMLWITSPKVLLMVKGLAQKEKIATMKSHKEFQNFKSQFSVGQLQNIYKIFQIEQ